MTDDELKKLSKKYPFQVYSFSDISLLEKNGFNFDNYSFNRKNENELYIGNINGLICRHTKGCPVKLFNYLKVDPKDNIKRKITFVLPENYRESFNGKDGFKQDIQLIFDHPLFKDQIKVITYKTDNSDIINKIEGLKGMKFDVCIGNPPYDGNGRPLYLQILEICNSLAKNTVWLCPTQWVKNYKDSKYLTKVKTDTCNNIISHEFIGNPFIGNAFVANDIGIFVFGNSKQYESYESIRLEKFSNPKLAKSIWDKFSNYKDSLFNHNKVDHKFLYYVHATELRGNVDKKTSKPKWDWTTLFGEEQHTNFSKPDKIYSIWNFETETECKNFIKSTETDIFMFSIFIAKNYQKNTYMIYEIMPWFGDYTHEWTDAMIQKELNLTDAEVSYIHDEMKNFGWKAASKK